VISLLQFTAQAGGHHDHANTTGNARYAELGMIVHQIDEIRLAGKTTGKKAVSAKIRWIVSYCSAPRMLRQSETGKLLT
jgi:hypothetical protein